ncbi:MAG: PKD domain-containing protein [Thermoleophilaceae bacterium]
MTGSSRLRALLFVLLATAVCASSMGAGSASAFRTIHHGDPFKAFPKGKIRQVAHASSGLVPLASTWPCQETTADRPALLSNAPQVKVLYVHPTDFGSHLTDATFHYADLIQTDAEAVRNKIGTSGRSVRFDVGATGNGCTGTPSQHLDIQTIPLAHDTAFYTGAQTFSRLTNELKAKLPAPLGRRVNYVVYADGVSPGGTVAGEADVPQDDSHDPLNAANQGIDGNGRLFAIIYGTGGPDFNGSHGPSARQATFLHELSHNLGAVQNSAPHSSGAGHCYDEQDIMCYADAGPYFTGGGPLQPQAGCSGTPYAFDEQYDCNQDDYFNPSPGANTYLAQNWNSFDSVYLCEVDACDTALAAPSGATVTATHPGGHLALAGNVASGTIAHYEWDIDGDGYYDADTGTTPSLSPVWDSPLTRTVSMRASKADGSFALATTTVAPTTPAPHFSITGKFQTGQPLQVDGTATEDPDGLIANFLWDLDGDDVYETNTGLTRTTSTVFANPGQFTIGLEVDYPFGASFARVGQPFTITPAFAPTPITGNLGGGATSVAGPTFSLTKVKIGKLLKSGLPLVVTCGGPCTARFALSVSPRTARKLHLKGKKGKLVVIGRATGGFASGTTKPKLTLTAAAKRALKKTRSLSAVLAGSVTQGSTPLKVSKPLTFKR